MASASSTGLTGKKGSESRKRIKRDNSHVIIAGVEGLEHANGLADPLLNGGRWVSVKEIDAHPSLRRLSPISAYP